MILLSNTFDDNFLFFKLLVLKLFGFVVYEYVFKLLFLDEYKIFWEDLNWFNSVLENVESIGDTKSDFSFKGNSLFISYYIIFYFYII